MTARAGYAYRAQVPPAWTNRAKCGTRLSDSYEVAVILGSAARQPQPKDLASLALRAKLLCTGCPVKPECADQALTDQATDMVYAGIAVPSRNNNPNTMVRLQAAYAQLERIAAPIRRRKKK